MRKYVCSDELFDGGGREVIPDGVSSPMRAFTRVEGAPICVRAGHGARVADADDNDYIRRGLDSVAARYLPHPFIERVTSANVSSVSRHFLAISLGFPYAISGAQLEVMQGFIGRNAAPDPLFECSAAVAIFLAWDEVGGNRAMLQHGMAGLQYIMNTQENFHGNLLKRDLEKILGEEVRPDFSLTGGYLNQLREQFANADHVQRCAAFVAFERHAEYVITALWSRLSALYGLHKSEFPYFDVHIGDEDPGEFYHVVMTEALIEKLVGDRLAEFLPAFERYFRTHIQWSTSISAS